MYRSLGVKGLRGPWKYINYIIIVVNYKVYFCMLGTAVAQWLRRWATNRKVAGSIPAGVTGI